MLDVLVLGSLVQMIVGLSRFGTLLFEGVRFLKGVTLLEGVRLFECIRIFEEMGFFCSQSSLVVLNENRRQYKSQQNNRP